MLLTSDSKHGNKCSIFGNTNWGQCLAISTRNVQQDLPPVISWLPVSLIHSKSFASAISFTISSINDDRFFPDSTTCKTVLANGSDKCSYDFNS